MKFFFLLSWLLFSHNSWAQKKETLTPFQTNIQRCVDKKIDVKSIDNNKKLYDAIEQFYALSSSETLYREVQYTQKGELKKLKLEDGVVQIFNVEDEDGTIKLLSTEKFGEKKEDNLVRYKFRSVEAKMNQLLFRADIKSDYQKIKETRSKKVVLNIIWSDNQIISLNIDFLREKKVLNCLLKEQSDICNCRIE